MGLLGLPIDVFNKAVEEEFGRKGAAVVEKNIEAVRKGAESVLELLADLLLISNLSQLMANKNCS